jgi:putative transposase
LIFVTKRYKMIIHKAYKIELKPNKTQVVLLNKSCGTARFAYNWGLAQRIKLYEAEQKSTSAITQHKELCAIKQDQFPWMYDVSKSAPQEALRNLDKAFQNFFKNIKQSKKPGFPKFKKKCNRESFCIAERAYSTGTHAHLPKIGKVRLKEAREIQGRIISTTVSKNVDRWFVSFCTEQNIPEPKIQNGQIIGVDLGLTHFATLSDGTKIENPKVLKHYLKKIARLQRRLAKKQKCSQNRQKARIRLAKVYRKVRNIRQDFLHKLTTNLAKTKQEIVIETLKVSNMLKNKRLAQSISDASWSEFVRQLEYKTTWYGSLLTKVDQFYPSSKLCSSCGYKLGKLSLSVRFWRCPVCGVLHDRDINAAMNLAACSKSVPSVQRELKPVESPLSGQQTYVARNGSMKQEISQTSGNVCKYL